jgi:DNA-binding XRE family transcriptional regulator
MTIKNVKLDGREYVLVPRKRWEMMTRQTEAERGKPLRMPAPMRDGSFGLEHVRISLANRMMAGRKAAGLTQAELARLARVRVETLSRLENGLHMPSVRTFDRIERALARAAKRPAA